MPKPGGADDGRGHAGTAEQPGQRDLGRGRAALGRDLSQPVYHVEVGVGVVPLVRQRVVSGPRGPALALAVPVAGQHAAGERTVGQHADALVGAEREHLPFLQIYDRLIDRPDPSGPGA